MRLKSLAGLAVMAGLMGAMLVPGEAMAVTCPPGSLRYEDDADVKSIAECNMSKDHATENLMLTVKDIINVILGVLGIVAVVVVIIGGVRFITSQGDAAQVAKGRNTILYGLIGLVVALLSYAIVNFVLKGISQNTTSGGGTPAATEPEGDPEGEE